MPDKVARRDNSELRNKQIAAASFAYFGVIQKSANCA
jgi:hypothetical protein